MPATGQDVDLMRGRVSPTGVRALGLVELVCALACLVHWLFPPEPDTNLTLLAATTVWSAAAGTVLLTLGLRGRTLPRVVVHGYLVVSASIAAVLVSVSASLAEALLGSYYFPLIAFYPAYFMPRTDARVQVVICAALFGAAFLQVDDGSVAIWAVVVAMSVAVNEVTSDLTGRLRRAARTDELTGLYNRYGIRQEIERELARAVRQVSPLSIAVIDVDGLKRLNDEQGHAAGDRLLAELADEWQRTIRRHDMLGRVGGDEFVLVLPDTDGVEAAELLARLHSARKPWSFGIATLRPDDDADALLARADDRMYRAKRMSRSHG